MKRMGNVDPLRASIMLIVGGIIEEIIERRGNYPSFVGSFFAQISIVWNRLLLNRMHGFLC